jgi:hypothetical protein
MRTPCRPDVRTSRTIFPSVELASVGIILACIFLQIYPVYAADGGVSGWRSLLRGMELQEWAGTESGNWTVRSQGTLVGQSKGAESWLFTRQQYGNFNLRFTYQIDEGAAASAAVRVPAGSTAVQERGYEIVLGKALAERYEAGSVLGIVPARENRGAAGGRLHNCQISVLDDRISVFIDGRKTADTHDRKSSKGMIGLKAPTKGAITIADLEIQPLPPSGKLPPTLKEAMDRAPGKFVSLIPQSGLEGWKLLWPDDGRWFVEENALVGTDVKSNSWLFTGRNYRDFILRLDFRLNEKSNGGVIYRYPWPTGDQRPSGPMARAAELQFAFSDREDPGAMHMHTTVPKGISKPNEWNTYEMYCFDDRVTVYVNGVKVTDWHNAVAREGAIGIQSSGSASTVGYRNIQVKEMPRGFVYP